MTGLWGAAEKRLLVFWVLFSLPQTRKFSDEQTNFCQLCVSFRLTPNSTHFCEGGVSGEAQKDERPPRPSQVRPWISTPVSTQLAGNAFGPKLPAFPALSVVSTLSHGNCISQMPPPTPPEVGARWQVWGRGAESLHPPRALFSNVNACRGSRILQQRGTYASSGWNFFTLNCLAKDDKLLRSHVRHIQVWKFTKKNLFVSQRGTTRLQHSSNYFLFESIT